MVPRSSGVWPRRRRARCAPPPRLRDKLGVHHLGGSVEPVRLPRERGLERLDGGRRSPGRRRGSPARDAARRSRYSLGCACDHRLRATESARVRRVRPPVSASASAWKRRASGWFERGRGFSRRQSAGEVAGPVVDPAEHCFGVGVTRIEGDRWTSLVAPGGRATPTLVVEKERIGCADGSTARRLRATSRTPRLPPYRFAYMSASASATRVAICAASGLAGAPPARPTVPSLTRTPHTGARSA